MEIEIIEEKKNPLFERKEIKFKVIHDGGTPKFEEIRSKIAAIKDLNSEDFVIQSVIAIYGTQTLVGEARVYKDNSTLMQVEQNYLLKKNGLIKETAEASEDEKQEE
ncbi:MAG: 30S ribosomal protein S24e [Candidatus Methanofastidiosia archaeon]